MVLNIRLKVIADFTILYIRDESCILFAQLAGVPAV